jgi:hypothetical protein
MVELTEERAATLKSAGYTHYIGYECYRPILDMWVETGFPTCADGLESHRAICKLRVARGEIREVSVFEL